MTRTRRPLQGALSLGAAGAIDYMLQFLLPILLVRSLDATEFGNYRVLWLVTNTVMAFAPFYMPQSLFFFLPRAGEKAGTYVANVLWFLVVVGGLAVLALGPWGFWRPEVVAGLPGAQALVPAFIALWIVGTLIEWLANAQGRVHAQARLIVAFSVLRVALVGGTAVITQDLWAVFAVMAVYAGLRVAWVVWAIVRHYGLAGLQPSWSLGWPQWRYAAPFGLAGATYNLRQQSDQWIAAALFKLEQFAVFSVSAVVLPLAGLVRQAVANAVLPAMNTRHHGGDLQGAVHINREANALTALLLFPALAYLFAFAEPVLTLIYTASYAEAAWPMRVYLLGLVGQALVVNNLLIMLAQGGFQLRLNGAFLPVAVLLSLFGAWNFGLAGAALGSAVTQWASHLLSVRHVRRLTSLPLPQLIDLRALAVFAAVAASAALGAWGAAWALLPATAAAQAFGGGVLFALLFGAMVWPTAACGRVRTSLKG